MEDRRIQASYLQIDKGIFANNITSTGNFQVSGSGVFNNEVIAPNLVYNTGNQTISGIKTFLDDLNISGDLTLNGGLYINDIEELNLTGANIYADNLVYNTGTQTISGTKTFATGVNISGHVGIGINSNNFNLYVRKSSPGAVNPDSDSIAVFEGSGNSHITVLASDAQSAGVVLGSPTDNFGSYLSWNHDNNELKLATANPGGFIQLSTNTETQAVRITSGANVGIGTISPSEKLQVVGNILANNLVYNTGDQTVSGVKTFATGVVVSGNLQVSGTGIFNALDLNNIDSLSFSGVDVTITSGIVTLTNAPILSGNPLITGNLSLYATTANLISTGSRIDTLSGQVVFTTGNQTISGIKSFATGIDIINSGNPQNLRVFNRTGTNTGEFGFFGWNNNQLTIGAQQTNSGILRDVILTGANININASGVLNIFDPVNITGNVTITGHLSATSKSFLIDHPTQINKKLQYGSLEGPEHGVFVRGKTNENIINLPNYWASLVDENSISVNLTPIDVFSNIYVVEYNNRRVVTDGNNGNYYFYTVYGERKDIPKLTVEF